MFKEAWFNPNSNGSHLVIVDRKSGKIQEFSLDKTYTDRRFKYKMTEEDKIKNVQDHGKDYDSEVEPDEVWGANGWKRMIRLEQAE